MPAMRKKERNGPGMVMNESVACGGRFAAGDGDVWALQRFAPKLRHTHRNTDTRMLGRKLGAFMTGALSEPWRRLAASRSIARVSPIPALLGRSNRETVMCSSLVATRSLGPYVVSTVPPVPSLQIGPHNKPSRTLSPRDFYRQSRWDELLREGVDSFHEPLRAYDKGHVHRALRGRFRRQAMGAAHLALYAVGCNHVS